MFLKDKNIFPKYITIKRIETLKRVEMLKLVSMLKHVKRKRQYFYLTNFTKNKTKEDEKTKNHQERRDKYSNNISFNKKNEQRSEK